MPKFTVSEEAPVKVAVRQDLSNIALTVNGIRVAFLSSYTGRLARYFLTDDDVLVLQRAGIAIKGGFIEIS